MINQAAARLAFAGPRWRIKVRATVSAGGRHAGAGKWRE